MQKTKQTSTKLLVIAITTAAIIAAVTTTFSLTALAQNMSGGTQEKSKLPAGNMTGNATNTTGTEGIFPTPTLND